MKNFFSLLTAILLVGVVMVGNAQAGSIERFTDLSGAVIDDGNPVMLGQEFYIVGSGFGYSLVNKYVVIDLSTSHGSFYMELIIEEWTDNNIKVLSPHLNSNCYRANLINIDSVSALIPGEVKDDLRGNTITGQLKIVELSSGVIRAFTEPPVALTVNFVERFSSQPPPITATVGGEEKPTFTARKAPLEGKLREDNPPISAKKEVTGTVSAFKPKITTMAPHEVQQGGTLWIHGAGFGSEKGTVIYRKGWLRSLRGRNAFIETDWYSSGCQIGVRIPDDMEPGSYYVYVKKNDGQESNVMETKIIE